VKRKRLERKRPAYVVGTETVTLQVRNQDVDFVSWALAVVAPYLLMISFT
jgi:hypothetical protein